MPVLYWIDGPWPGRLAIATRPRGADWLDDEAAGWRRAGVDVIVSLLEPHEAELLGLSDEAMAAENQEIRFVSFPIPDRDVPPSTAAAVTVIREILSSLEASRTVAIHCRQGVGRSGLIASGVLIAAGVPVESALATVGAARGQTVPETAPQLAWIRGLGSGRLVSAR